MAFLIAGGSGFIGRSLTSFYRSRGHKVFVVTRSPKNEDDISWVNLKENGLPKDIKAVINLCGRSVADLSPLYIFDSHYQPYKKEIIDSRIETTKSLVNLIRSSNNRPDIFINASAIGFYKPSIDEIYNEKSPYVEHDFMSNLCRNWEEAAQIPDISDIRKIQIRIGLVLGSGGGILQKMYLPFILGLGGPIGNGQQWMSWIHIEDIIGLIDFSINNKNIENGPLNGTAPNPVSNSQFSKSLGRALCRPALLPAPKFTFKLFFGERAPLFLEGQRVLPQKSLDCGYKFKYSFVDEAMRAVYNK